MDPSQNLTPKQIRFLRCFEACASVTQAARWAKIVRRTHYDWLEQSPMYVQAFDRAEKVAGRTLEDEAVRRAHEGLRKAVRYRGKIVGWEYEYSDALLQTLLKGNLPKKYRDNASVEHLGKDGANLFGDLTAARKAILESLAGLPPKTIAAVAQKLLESDGTPR